MSRLKLCLLGAALALTAPAPGFAQGSIVPGGSTPSGAGTGAVQSAPLAPPPGTPALPETKPAEPKPAESVPTTPAAPPAAPAAAASPAAPMPAAPQPQSTTPTTPPAAAAAPAAVDPNATLAGKPGDTGNVDDITLVPKSAALVTGKASWDEGMKTLAGVFERMAAEATRAGAKIAGRPLAIFVETDDANFRYEAYLPLDRIPEGRDSLGQDIRFGQTPAGRALRFTHKNPYDDIDSTYEVITAYLDAKGVTVHDAFIEEYVGDLKEADDAGFEVNVYVQPR